MNARLTLLASRFLNAYSDRLANAGCNDWRYPYTWTQEECIEFNRAYHEWNGSSDEFTSTNLSLPDFAVARYLSHLLALDSHRYGGLA